MAHFAELDDENVVVRVLVVDNERCVDADGSEQEAVGAAFLSTLIGGRWVQTSYNGRIRKNYAGIGFSYDSFRDAFIPPQSFPSWVLDETTCLWQPPVPYPGDGAEYNWDEATVSWVPIA